MLVISGVPETIQLSESDLVQNFANTHTHIHKYGQGTKGPRDFIYTKNKRHCKWRQNFRSLAAKELQPKVLRKSKEPADNAKIFIHLFSSIVLWCYYLIHSPWLSRNVLFFFSFVGQYKCLDFLFHFKLFLLFPLFHSEIMFLNVLIIWSIN
jgi:hypothetical protein